MKNIDEKNQKIILLKGIAILSVVFAHCNNRISTNIVEMVLNQVAVNIGTIGVPIFLYYRKFLLPEESWIKIARQKRA